MKFKIYTLFAFLLFLNPANTFAQQVMMQGFYWDYPKTAQGYNWSNTLSGQASALGTAGFTHLWFPPFAGNGTMSGGYDPKDLYIGPLATSPTALGTKQEIKNMITTLQANGIKAVGDMVYNHRDAGDPENNPAVKEYMLFYAGSSTGTCPGTSFKSPFPSDRVRMTIPIGGATGIGTGDYYFSIKSRGNIYNGAKYMLFVTTTKAGGGSAWDFVNGCGAGASAVTISSDIPATGAPQVTALKQGYWNTIDSNGDTDEFKVSLDPSNYNTAGDVLIIQAINTCGAYSDHVINKIYYTGTSSDIADPNNWNSASYKLNFQTYTDFTNMPSGQGSSNWASFRPNWNATGVSTAGGASTTCLGPEYSMQSMDYFYDYDHLQTSSQTTLTDWTKWAWDDLGIRGLRMDAIKHFEAEFVGKMLTSMYDAGKSPDLVVGEWYGQENPAIQNWVSSVNASMSTAAKAVIKPKVFDFGLRDALKQACDNGADARNIFTGSFRDGRGMSGFNLVSFVNNHDFRSATPSNGDALVWNNTNLAYAYILTNNQVGVPSVFYPDYYGYPAHNTTYGANTYSFDYHPTGLSPMKTDIDKLIRVLKLYINGSTSVDYLNTFSTAKASNYIAGSANKCLIYQLNATGSAGGKEVVVAINFGTTRLQVDQEITVRNGVTPSPNSTATNGTPFTDILGNSAFPTAYVNNQSRIYIDLPPKSFSVWVQGVATVLPVDLLGFEATAQDKSVNLSWKTSSEKNFQTFDIQRSTDAINYTSLANIPAKAIETKGAEYAYTDLELPDAKILYYRLKIIDKDGTFAYSRPKAIKIGEVGFSMKISPNPSLANAVLTVKTNERFESQVKLYDQQGQTLFSTDFILKEGENTLTLPTEKLPQGTYQVVLSDGLKRWTVKLMR